MLIDDYISESGVNGAQFARELLALKNEGKTHVEVWINSKGGNVREGYSIYGAIKNSGIHVTTVNQGLVDSTAGWIFQAGNTRIWMAHALGLVHNAVNAAGETIEEVNQSIATMLASKSTLAEDAIRDLMNQDTILTADRAKELGLWEIVNQALEIATTINCSTAAQAIEAGDTVIKKKKHSMELNALLGLANEADATAQAQAIQSLITAKNTAESKVTELTTEVASLQEKIASTENAAKEKAADELISKNAGIKFADDDATKAKWKALAIADFENASSLLESIPVNRKAPATPTAEPKTPTTTTAGAVTSVGEYYASHPKRI